MEIIQEKIRPFLKPNKMKIIVFVILLFYGFSMSVLTPWGHSSSPLPILLFFPLAIMGGLALLLVFPYAYIVACIISTAFNSIKDRKFLLTAILLILFFLLGMDEPLINSTINKPDYSCTASSDCVVTSITKGMCGNPQCVNENWNYYDSRINRVFALSCRPPLISCSCVENKCQSKDLYKSTNIQDCENLEGYQKDYCVTVMSSRISESK